MPIENWQSDLAQLMFSFKAEPHPLLAEDQGDIDRSLIDQFGNRISFGHTAISCLAPALLNLLKHPEIKTVEIDGVDKGYLSYSLYRHEESYYILYETRNNLAGACGNFTSFVVVPTLEPVIQFVENLVENSDY
jgi:hypothetical protein